MEPLPQEKSQLQFMLAPTYTSNINKMGTPYDPRVVLGIIQGNDDLKNINEYNYENKLRVLTSIDTILQNEIENISVEQVAFYFSEKIKGTDIDPNDIQLLSLQYEAHLASKTEKIKQKPKPMPSPSDSSLSPKQREELENKQKHELAQRKSLQMTPFRIPKTPL